MIFVLRKSHQCLYGIVLSCVLCTRANTQKQLTKVCFALLILRYILLVCTQNTLAQPHKYSRLCTRKTTIHQSIKYTLSAAQASAKTSSSTSSTSAAKQHHEMLPHNATHTQKYVRPRKNGEAAEGVPPHQHMMPSSRINIHSHHRINTLMPSFPIWLSTNSPPPPFRSCEFASFRSLHFNWPRTLDDSDIRTTHSGDSLLSSAYLRATVTCAFCDLNVYIV